MRQLQNGKEDEELVPCCCVCYIVKYIDDGVISMKNEDELEFLEIPCDGRTSFLLGNKINTKWDDGEMYEAEIVDVGPKPILQGQMHQHRQKNDQGKKKSDLAHEMKKQAADISWQ
uniref:Tudor domain-containing protein n=1 Tax=Amphimedon queenslandica TaxID=400682 RepID=A0A1X7T912_AMPQE